MTDTIPRQAVEKAIHDAIGKQCLQNHKTSAGEYSAVAIAAVRAIPAVTVTDEMVERAVNTYQGDSGDWVFVRIP